MSRLSWPPAATPSRPAASHRHLPLFAVGDATAALARAAGFTEVHSAAGDSGALAVLVARHCDRNAGPLLFTCGRGQGRELAGDLRQRGFVVVRRAVYVAVPVRVLPEAARDALVRGGLTAAVFFSAEAARQCVRLLRAARLHEAVRSVAALAIGQSTAVALQALPWRRIDVAAQPNQEAMLALLR